MPFGRIGHALNFTKDGKTMSDKITQPNESSIKHGKSSHSLCFRDILIDQKNFIVYFYK